LRRGNWGIVAVLAAGMATAIAAMGVPAAAAPTTAPSLTNAAATSGWRAAYTVKSAAGMFNAVAATGPRNAWAVGMSWPRSGGTGPLVAHFNGSKWATETIPGTKGFELTQVEASSASNVWVVGESTPTVSLKLFHYDGAHWHTVSAPGQGMLVVLGPKDVWLGAAGGSCNSISNPKKCTTSIWHWNGSTWTSRAIGADVSDLAGISDDDMWVVGYTGEKQEGIGPGTLAAYRWNGKKWLKVALPAVRGEDLPDVALDASNDVWIDISVNDYAGLLLHWNGSHWQKITGGYAGTVTPDGHGGAWLSNSTHWTGDAWVNVSISSLDIVSAGFAPTLARVPGATGSYWQGASLQPKSNALSYATILVYGPTP
jgi:hypothetical protein